MHEPRAAPHCCGFLKFSYHVIRKADAGRGGIGNSVCGQRLHNILFTRFFPRLPGSGGGLSTVGSRRTALNAGVHVGFVVIAHKNAIFVALHSPAETLETDVKSPPVARPGEYRRFPVSNHIQGCPQSTGGGTGSGKRRVQHGNFQCILRIWTGDDSPTAGRDDDHGFFAQCLQGKLHGNGSAASGTAQMAGVH